MGKIGVKGSRQRKQHAQNLGWEQVMLLVPNVPRVLSARAGGLREV